MMLRYDAAESLLFTGKDFLNWKSSMMQFWQNNLRTIRLSIIMRGTVCSGFQAKPV